MNDRPDAEGDNKKPGVVTSYNMPSLLNIPAAMELYGPLVNLWEGKNMGEGILHLVKSEMKMGLRVGWQKRLLLRLLRAKALSSIMNVLGMKDVYDILDDEEDEEEEEGDADDSTIRVNERGVYHRYKTMGDIYAGIAARHPVSLVQLESGEFRAVVGKLQGPDQLVAVTFLEEEAGIAHAGLHYWTWKVGVEVGDLNPDCVVRSVLLLPYLMENKEGVYAAISTAWAEMEADGDFVVPPLLSTEE